MHSVPGRIEAHLLAAVVLVVALLGLGGSVGHAAGPNAQVSQQFVAEEAPAPDDGGDDSSSDEPESEPEPAPEPEPEPAPAQQPEQEPAPIAESSADSTEAVTGASNDDDTSANDSGGESGAKDAKDSDAGLGNGRAGVGSADLTSPLREQVDSSPSSLVTDDGPSPLGWLLLAAGVACGVASYAVYRGGRPVGDWGVSQSVVEAAGGPPATPDYADGLVGPNTVEMNSVKP